MNNKKLIVAATFTNSFDANLAMTKLRDEGIPCILDGETISDIWGGNMSLPFSGIRLMVNQNDAEYARHLLAAILAADNS